MGMGMHTPCLADAAARTNYACFIALVRLAACFVTHGLDLQHMKAIGEAGNLHREDRMPSRSSDSESRA